MKSMYAFTNKKGITLVELVFAILILSMIIGIGGPTLVFLLKNSEVEETRSIGMRQIEKALNCIRLDAANMTAQNINGISAFEQGETADYRMLVKCKPDLMDRTDAPLAMAYLARYSIKERNDTLELHYSKQSIGYDGSTGMEKSGLLVEQLQDFRMIPHYEKPGEQSERLTPEDVNGRPEVPTSIEVRFQIRTDQNQTMKIETMVPVHATLIKKEDS